MTNHRERAINATLDAVRSGIVAHAARAVDLLTTHITIEATKRLLDDAESPLRKRIAELEDAVKQAAETSQEQSQEIARLRERLDAIEGRVKP